MTVIIPLRLIYLTQTDDLHIDNPETTHQNY